ncbi:transcriptional regulator with XRE-family HTH domain [Streptomyces sp. B4I13]|nr:transcriptional regulator [Streptomyces sp. B4I13]MDQ0960681.1 transcriptional regulator with XRE-family HTH domain [Streptomyces sp. B4I13]
MKAAEEIADFAALMRDLKQRSGLSYEALAKRAHMSTSTLHRYCKGDGVPGDNAAVARFARVCRATPEELVELHRRWVLADAARERARRAAADADRDSAARPGATTPISIPGPDTGPGPGSLEPRSAQAPTPAPGSAPTPAPGSASTPAPGSTTGPPTLSGAGEAAGSVADPSPQPAGPAGRMPTRLRTARRRWVLIAAGTAAAVAVTTALTLDLKGVGTGPAENARPADSAASSGRQSAASPARPSQRPSPSQDPSASPGTTDATSSSAAGRDPGRDRDRDAVPLTVSTRTYAWEDPQCEGEYLIDRPPGEVSPPVMGQDVPGWVKAHGAVAADGQRVALTVQGTGDDTVVIESLHVRVVDSSAPPAWNSYLGSSGCGGGVETRSFVTDLDAGRPVIVPRAGQRGVPYKVSRSDPEVLYVTAHARDHDVKWYVELLWSSGGRQGTIRIDDHGKPFRTSGSRGRPLYEFLLGGTEWIRVAENNG